MISPTPAMSPLIMTIGRESNRSTSQPTSGPPIPASPLDRAKINEVLVLLSIRSFWIGR